MFVEYVQDRLDFLDIKILALAKYITGLPASSERDKNSLSGDRKIAKGFGDAVRKGLKDRKRNGHFYVSHIRIHLIRHLDDDDLAVRDSMFSTKILIFSAKGRYNKYKLRDRQIANSI